jgi:hypothetical protein
MCKILVQWDFNRNLVKSNLSYTESGDDRYKPKVAHQIYFTADYMLNFIRTGRCTTGRAQEKKKDMNNFLTGLSFCKFL